MFDDLLKLTYESPGIVSFGPVWSALLCGFVMVIGNRIYLTDAGERYLGNLKEPDNNPIMKD